MLRRMKQMVQQMEQLDLTQSQPDDKSWVEALPLDDYDRRVIKDYTENGQLKHLPVKPKKLMAVLRWIVPVFEAERQYTERSERRLESGVRVMPVPRFLEALWDDAIVVPGG
jgi:hypothetical protein